MRAVLSRVFALLSLLAVFNLAAAPVARATAPASVSVEQVAADLRATFGDVVQLCVNDDGSPSNLPVHHDHDCPLCCLQSAAVLFPPDQPALPTTRVFRTLVRLVSPDFAPPPPARASPAQPRAPPARS